MKYIGNLLRWLFSRDESVVLSQYGTTIDHVYTAAAQDVAKTLLEYGKKTYMQGDMKGLLRYHGFTVCEKLQYPHKDQYEYHVVIKVGWLLYLVVLCKHANDFWHKNMWTVQLCSREKKSNTLTVLEYSDTLGALLV